MGTIEIDSMTVGPYCIGYYWNRQYGYRPVLCLGTTGIDRKNDSGITGISTQCGHGAIAVLCIAKIGTQGDHGAIAVLCIAEIGTQGGHGAIAIFRYC